MDDDIALTESEGRFPMRCVLYAALVLPVLALPIYTGITRCRCRPPGVATAQVGISDMVSLIESHVQTAGGYPWQTANPLPADGNLFPACFDALREVDPTWPGRRSVALVRDGPAGFRRARSEEIDDVTIDRYLADPWGEPYLLRQPRPNRKDSDRWLCGSSFGLYSNGADRVDQTRAGATVEESDDIGNW